MGVLLLNPAADDVIVGDDDFDDETVTSVEVMMNVGMAKFNFGRKEHAGTCVEVPGISSVWPSHQRVTLWCNGLRARHRRLQTFALEGASGGVRQKYGVN